MSLATHRAKIRKLKSWLLISAFVATSGAFLVVQEQPSRASASITSLEWVPSTIRFNQPYSLKVNGSTSNSITTSIQMCSVYKITDLDTAAIRYILDSKPTGPGTTWTGISTRTYSYNISASEKWEYRLFEEVDCGSLTDEQVFLAANIGGVTPVEALQIKLKDSAAIPPTPASLSVVALDTKVRVTWPRVTDTTSYSVVSVPSGGTCTVAAPATTCDVGPLTNGVSYTFTLTATNAMGSSFLADTTAVSPAPLVVPDKPTLLVATAGNTLATLTWSAPTTGTSPFTYTIASTPSGAVCTFSGTTATCRSLTNDTSYTFTVTASNVGGSAGVPSDASVAVTPKVPVVPGATGTPTAVAGIGQATVSWTAPTTGDSPVSYRATAFPSGNACTATAPATTCIVSGLISGTSYTFTVVATNGAGNSTSSGSSAAVTPTGSGGGGSGGGGSGSGSGGGGSTPTKPVLDLGANLGGGSGAEAAPEIIPGKLFTLAGSGMETVTVVRVGGKKAAITEVTKTSLKFRVPKNLPAGSYNLKLSGTFGDIDLEDYLRVDKRVTLDVVVGFAGDSSVLSKLVSDGISKALAKLNGGVILVCKGSTSGRTVTNFDTRLARERAQAACDFAKTVYPGIKTKIRLSPASDIGAKARHVQLTYRNY